MGGSPLDGFYRRGDAAVPRQHHDAGVRVEVVQRPDELEARASRHAEVHHGDLRRLFGGEPRPLGNVGRATHLERALPQRAGEPLAEGRVVIHKQNGSPFAHAPRSPSIGRLTTTPRRAAVTAKATHMPRRCSCMSWLPCTCRWPWAEGVAHAARSAGQKSEA